MKRKDCDTEMPEMPCIQQRLAKCPRYAAIIERIRSRGTGPEAANDPVGRGNLSQWSES